ncbi:MAG: phospho-N-acetylmuramoyl-pentapeptide-transferase [Duncaniella sp.]|uniref:phospho-N-acetylmuramoyl-pentapeptide- transferase n=1 Tax=Duncaniella sp. TaxID=2518496 RepID=UPI0019C9E9AE|nr:phospho-N-acetylmuramoyl-pentapeptide-transferase [Duncaniella sp.]MBD5313204.1 phospho-N-acetylmuramoyl-pentapeptide-transferase [Bacteroides sp.]MBD5334155.1 phospho-N-acetylmuramoyl-pentapeptide-transferase [Bacteroides sp.]MDE6091441.1 phospho-N-acetylmuramoyl-pentapeptide-transferase [Duncaniella sp.]
MLYYLFDLLQEYNFPGSRLMTYITFRSGAALLLSLFIALVFGRKIIDRLQLMQVGEIIRDLGLEGQMQKTGTPTMGGVIIIISILVPCLLVGDLSNIYMILMLISTIWLGTLGFCDDYIKVAKHDKEGMKGKFKIIGQVGLGLMVGLTMYISPAITQRQVIPVKYSSDNVETVYLSQSQDVKSTQTTIPFVKDNNFDYAYLTEWMGPYAQTGGWIVFVLVVIFAVAATSNGANLTDGLDGLCAGTSAIICVALAIMAYLGGNVIYSTYLNIMYIPQSAELVVFMSAFIGALIGFLWYNAYPAQVFMGDTGSLTIGGIIAVFAILIHKELLIPILCAIFFVEDLSVMLQVAYFKYTKKKYGAGRRIFKMTPLHHHYQKPGNSGIEALIQAPLRAIPESKIVTRFWIVGIFLAVITFVTLKIR